MKKVVILIIIVLLLFIPVTANNDIPEVLTKEHNFSTPNIDTNSKVTDSLMPENIFKYFFSSLKKSILEIPVTLSTLIVIIFLSSVTGIFVKSTSLSKIPEYCSVFAVILLCFNLLEPLINTVSIYLENYISFMTSMISTLTVILSSSGNASTALTTSSSAAFAIGITQVCSLNLILPLAKTLICLSVISTLSQTLDLSGIINFIRSTCAWGLGALFAVFGGVHTAAVHISSSADSLVLRSIRFSAARLIPVAGNMISESMRTVASGIKIIKTTAGGIGIAYILYSLIPVITAILAVKMIILVSIFADKLIGKKLYTQFLEGVNASINILMGICIFSSVSGIIIFAVFMNTVTSL